MIENGDTVVWTGEIPERLLTNPENINALQAGKLYTVKEHWNSSDWCQLEEIEFYGYPRSMFILCVCEFEDVLANVI